MGRFLAALGLGYSLVIQPTSGFLVELASFAGHPPLAHSFVFQGAVDGLEAVHVLDFHLGEGLRGALRADADVGIAAEAAFLHVAGGDAEILENGAQFHQVLPGLFRRTQVGLADDLHQGDAGAVDVDEAVRFPGGISPVQQFGHILFQVHPLDVDAAAAAVGLQLDPALYGDGLVILRYLVALHQVRVGIVLAVELGEPRDSAIQGQRGHDGAFDSLAVDRRENTRHAHAYGADVGVGWGVRIGRGTAAEHLALGQELGVDLQPDDGFIGHG